MERWKDACFVGSLCPRLLHTRLAKHCGERANRRRRGQACQNSYPAVTRSPDEMDQGYSFGGDN